MRGIISKKIKLILEKIRPIIKTDPKYLFKGGFWVSADFILGSLLSLGLSVVFANYLSKETYGTYKYIMSLAGSLGFLTLTGMNIAVTQAVANGQNGILKFAVNKQLVWNSMLGVALMGLAGYYFIHGNYVFAGALLILSLTIPSTSALNTYGAFLAGKKDFKKAAMFSTLSHLIYIVCMILTVVFSGQLIFIFIAYGLSNVLPQIYFYFWVVRKFKLKETRNEEQKSLLNKYAQKLSFLNIFSSISQNIDQIIAFQLVGPAALASFAIANSIPDRIRGYMKSMLSVLFPKMANRDQESLQESFYLRLVQTFLVGSSISLVSILILPYFFNLFFKQYLDAIFYAQLISLNFIFLFPQSYAGLYFQSQKLIKYIYASSLTTNILRLAIYSILAYFYGIMGLIIGKLISNIFGLILNITLFEIQKRNS